MNNDVQTSVEEEEIGYYDFIGQLGIPYHHWGGLKSTDEMLKMCEVSPEKKVLFVGCGTGYTACYTADMFDCQVTGIDISEGMVTAAQDRAEKWGLADRVTFELGDAYNLRFDNDSFDVILTEFVTLFLDKTRALQEYQRVLKPNGYVGVNEIYKEENIPNEPLEIITKAEGQIEEATGLPFEMPSPSQWKNWFDESGLTDVKCTQVHYQDSYSDQAKVMGGWGKTLKMLGRVMYHMMFNKRVRGNMMKIGRAKKVLQRDKRTKEYIGIILCTGRKQ